MFSELLFTIVRIFPLKRAGMIDLRPKNKSETYDPPPKKKYRKIPNRGAGCVGKPLGGERTERTVSPSSGFLQIENRTIFG